MADWEDIEPPRSAGPFPDWIDWLEYREDRAHELMRWRRDTIRSVDTKRITSSLTAWLLGEYLHVIG